MAEPLIVRELRKRYGPVEAVRGVNFAVRAGEVFGMLGPNGAGKTTTLECVLGLREPDGGSVEVCGMDARGRRREVKERIGAALQVTALQDQVTPREALRVFGSFYAKHAAVDALLERFALREKADAAYATLSGGQRQRLALALAFVNEPEVVFLDEPTAGLDPQSRRELRGQVAAMKKSGATVVLTTHDIEEAEQLCDRVAIIDHGRIVAEGPPHALVAGAKAAALVTVETARPLERALIERLPGMVEISGEGNVQRFRTTKLSQGLVELVKLLDAQRVELVDLHVQRATLEDVFIELTGNRLRD